MRNNTIRANSFFLIIALLILPSPILHAWGVSYQIRSLLVAVIDFYLIIKHRGIISKRFVSYFLLMLLMGTITALAYLSFDYFVLFYCYIFYCFLINNCTNEDISSFIDIASNFMLLLEIGAFIGFIYVFKGGQPTYYFYNPDSRINCVYLTTFTNSWVGRFIRPSGIYDEPGALAFFISSVIALRIFYKKDNNKTLLLLLLGNITFSVAYILCEVFLYFIIRKKLNNKLKIAIDFITVILISSIFIVFYDIINDIVLSRFKIDATTNKLQGDNRSSQITNSIKYIKDYGLLFGYYHHIDNDIILRNYGTITENPLTPITRFGLFNSMPYTLFFLLGGVLLVVSPKNLIVIVPLLLFMQRPYYDALGYTGFFTLFLNIFANRFYNTSSKILKYNGKLQ